MYQQRKAQAHQVFRRMASLFGQKIYNRLFTIEILCKLGDEKELMRFRREWAHQELVGAGTMPFNLL
jgi:hypothetical protein